MMDDTAQTNPAPSDVVDVSHLRVSVLIPVFNSEDTIGQLIDDVIREIESKCADIEIVAVNDGSADNSHEVLLAAVERHPRMVKYVRLARNFGEHGAVMCGLHYVTGDCVVIIDDDFQNPPDQILHLVRRLDEGFDVVYSFYEEKHHALHRNLGSAFNDWMATRLLGKPKGLYLSSFKAMNRFLIDAVTEYEGPYPYLDGLVLRYTSSIGTQKCVHAPRTVGHSNYNARRLIRLWLNMFTGFSVKPLRIASLLGFLMSATGLALAVFFMISWLVGGIFRSQDIPPGWASLIITITIFAGLQLSVLGMIGEYLGRVLQTTNRTPQFVVRETFGKPSSSRSVHEQSVSKV